MSSWSPHIYIAEGKRDGLSREYLKKLEKYGRNLLSENLPVVFTLNHLAYLTDTDFDRLDAVVCRKMDPYRLFSIQKRRQQRDKQAYRQIASPYPFLFNVQRWIHNNILLSRDAHPFSTAYMVGCNPAHNAELHCGAKWLVKMDIVRFFESISERQIFHIFKKMGYTKMLSFSLARLTTRIQENSPKYAKSKRWNGVRGNRPIPNRAGGRIGHLPQGAPTSPILANLVCYPMDIKLSELAETFGCMYSRYADDITFSSLYLTREKAVQLIRESTVMLSEFGFKRHDKKTVIIPPGARKIVTGLLVDRDRPRLTKKYRENVECHLYFAKKFGVIEHCQRRKFHSLTGFYHHLKGLISYAIQVDPELGYNYKDQFDSIDWSLISDYKGV